MVATSYLKYTAGDAHNSYLEIHVHVHVHVDEMVHSTRVPPLFIDIRNREIER